MKGGAVQTFFSGCAAMKKTMLKKTGLWRGLAGLLLALTMLAIFTTAVLFQYASVINQT